MAAGGRTEPLGPLPARSGPPPESGPEAAGGHPRGQGSPNAGFDPYTDDSAIRQRSAASVLFAPADHDVCVSVCAYRFSDTFPMYRYLQNVIICSRFRKRARRDSNSRPSVP